MVMMSVRVKAIIATIGRTKGDRIRKNLDRKLGNLIRTRWKGKALVIEGDALRDWQVREWIHRQLEAS
jgi:hypothetical protein